MGRIVVGRRTAEGSKKMSKLRSFASAGQAVAVPWDTNPVDVEIRDAWAARRAPLPQRPGALVFILAAPVSVKQLMLQSVRKPCAVPVLAPAALADEGMVQAGVVVDPDQVAGGVHRQAFAQSVPFLQ